MNTDWREVRAEALAVWNSRPESPWIDFRTRRPADGQECIVYADSWPHVVQMKFQGERHPHAAYFDNHWMIIPAMDFVYLFWQPLPAPPSAEMIERAKEGKRRVKE